MCKLLLVSSLFSALAWVAAASSAGAEQAAPPLVVADGVFVRDGKPYRGIGVNYFDLFARVLAKPDDTSYREGLDTLARYRIPFARFMAGGFWPANNKLYFEDRERYFALFDGVVKAAEERGIGLIPSFFWNLCTAPDLNGEPMDQWGNPQSKTHAFMRQYVREVVTRYRGSPAIWGWEFGNEYNLGADLPNAKEHRPAVWPTLGTAKERTARDEVTHDMVRTAFAEFAREVRRHDPRRPIFTGNSLPRPSAWHQKAERSWKQDSEEQYAEMLAGDNPDPVDTLTVHVYPKEGKRFGRDATAEEVLRATLAVAAKAKKPLFVGEFGASEKVDREGDASDAPMKERRDFAELLAGIEKTGVPLAALWVYDFGGQKDTWNVTLTNQRAYQLEAIRDANARLRK